MNDLVLIITFIISLLQVIAGFIIIFKNKESKPAEKESSIPMAGVVLIGFADVILIIILLMYS